MNILCDIDGVICHYDFPALTKKYFGVEIPNDGIWTYSLEDALGVPPSEVVEMFKIEAFSPPNWIEGAIETLQEFVQRGDNVVINSNRVHFMGEDGLLLWLDKYKVPHTDVSFKTPLTHFNYYIDDSPTKLLSSKFFVANKLLFDSPWNAQCLNIRGALRRVHNWKEIKEVVNEASNIK